MTADGSPATVVVARRGVPYGTEVPIEPGVQARTVHVVGEADTAVAMGTGEVPVLATSRLVAWSEQTSLEAMGDQGPEGSTTVAMRVHLDHLKAASIGCSVTTIATLERIEGRRYIFVVTNLDPGKEVLAQGRVVRVIVETSAFLASACQGSPDDQTSSGPTSHDVGA